MNPIEFMEALGNIPNDLIEICFDEAAITPKAKNEPDILPSTIPDSRGIHRHKVLAVLSVAAACFAILLLSAVYPRLRITPPNISNNPNHLELSSSDTSASETTGIQTGDTGNASQTTAVTGIIQTSSTISSDAAQTQASIVSSRTQTTATDPMKTQSTLSTQTTVNTNVSEIVPPETDITTTKNEAETTDSSFDIHSHELSVTRTVVDIQSADTNDGFRYDTKVCDSSDDFPGQITGIDWAEYRCIVIDTFSADNMLWSASLTGNALQFEMSYGDSEMKTEIKHIRYCVFIPKQLVFDADSCRIHAVYQPGIHTAYSSYKSYAIPIETLISQN